VCAGVGVAGATAALAGQRPRHREITASIAPFQLKQNGMSYSWDGVVTRAGAEKPNKPGS
jgi:hypothetical protein